MLTLTQSSARYNGKRKEFFFLPKSHARPNFSPGILVPACRFRLRYRWAGLPWDCILSPMETWHIYILRCSDGTLYTGVAKDLGKRVEAHETGNGAKYTRGRLPVKLVYRERRRSKGRALRREAEIKKWSKDRKEALVGKERGVTPQTFVKR